MSSSAATGSPDDNENEKKDDSGKRLSRADAFHAVLSNSLNTSADWIDSFFGEERTEIEEDNSSLRLKFSGFRESRKNIDFEVKGRLHLVLPNLENKLHIFASSILEEDENDIDVFDPENEKSGAPRNFYLSMRYFIRSAERMNLSLRAGLKFHKLTPALFAGPRYSYLKKWNSWSFRFIEDLSYFTDIGWESRSSVDFEKPVSKSLFYRTNFSGIWHENERGYEYWADTNLYHTLRDDKAFNYRIRGKFNTYPNNQLTSLLAGVRYRQSFWRKWLFFEIAPQVVFRREEDYDASPGITLSLEIFLGKGYINDTIRHL